MLDWDPKDKQGPNWNTILFGYTINLPKEEEDHAIWPLLQPGNMEMPMV